MDEKKELLSEIEKKNKHIKSLKEELRRIPGNSPASQMKKDEIAAAVNERNALSARIGRIETEMVVRNIKKMQGELEKLPKEDTLVEMTRDG